MCADEVQHIDYAQEIDQGINQEIDVGRSCLLVPNRIPIAADGLVETLVEQGEAANHPHSRGHEQGHANLLTVANEVQRQLLPLERIVEGLVAALHFIPFQINEHVSEASRYAHEHRDQGADHRQPRKMPGGHPAQSQHAQDNGEEQRPGRPGEQPLPENKPVPDTPADEPAHDSQEPADQTALEKDSGDDCKPAQRVQDQVRRMELI